MSDYTQGICRDGAAILKDGVPMTIDDIVTELSELNKRRVASSNASFYISCYMHNAPILSHYPVDEAVYIYVKQLESYIKNPEISNLKKVYKERFKSS